jgi:hypothetical protein
VKVGTIFENSPIALSKWIFALWILIKRRRVSSYALARAVGVTQKTAWLMLYRIRMAMRAPSFKQFNAASGVDTSILRALRSEQQLMIDGSKHLAYAHLRKHSEVNEHHHGHARSAAKDRS